MINTEIKGTKSKRSITDEKFWDLIKDDPKAIREYHEGIVELYETLIADERRKTLSILDWYAKQVPLGEKDTFEYHVRLNLLVDFICSRF